LHGFPAQIYPLGIFVLGGTTDPAATIDLDSTITPSPISTPGPITEFEDILQESI